jgi:hypothetical protein
VNATTLLQEGLSESFIPVFSLLDNLKKDFAFRQTMLGGNSGTEFDSSYLPSGKKFQHQFTSTGQYSYYCTLHPFMMGTVYVTATIGSN